MNPTNRTVEEIARELVSQWGFESTVTPGDLAVRIAEALRAERERVTEIEASVEAQMKDLLAREDAVEVERDELRIQLAAELIVVCSECEATVMYKREGSKINLIHSCTPKRIRESHAKLQGELAAERERGEWGRQSHADLLSVIHGDGGHYIEQHGWEKAQLDAIEVIYKLLVELERGGAAMLPVKIRRVIAEPVPLSGESDD